MIPKKKFLLLSTLKIIVLINIFVDILSGFFDE